MSNKDGVVIADRYAIMEELGHGAYGTVVRAYKKLINNRLSCEQYAIKHIDKKKAGRKGLQEVYTEVETLMLLNHPNIIHLEETFQDTENLWIVMEYDAGGELAQVLAEKKRLSEGDTRKMVTYLASGLQYIHEKGFVHRDLKPENCLLVNPGEPLIKIADFGFAVLSGKSDCLRSYVGTMAYMAPEILLDMNYGKAVDMWALGVMVFQMLSGELPFQPRKKKKIAEVIAEDQFSFSSQIWRDISMEAKSFINRLLVVDSSKRATAADCLEHDWLLHAMDKVEIRGSFSGMLPNTRKVEKNLFRIAGFVVMAAHRLIYLGKCEKLDSEGLHMKMLKSFSYMVRGVYRAPNKYVNCNGIFVNHHRELLAFLRIVSTSVDVETLDLRNNNIDNLEVAQAVVKAATNHASLVNLLLDGNPLPHLIGRGLTRLARTPLHLRKISLTSTMLVPDVVEQINITLKERKNKQTVTERKSPSSPSVNVQYPQGTVMDARIREKLTNELLSRNNSRRSAASPRSISRPPISKQE